MRFNGNEQIDKGISACTRYGTEDGRWEKRYSQRKDVASEKASQSGTTLRGMAVRFPEFVIQAEELRSGPTQRGDRTSPLNR